MSFEHSAHHLHSAARDIAEWEARHIAARYDLLSRELLDMSPLAPVSRIERVTTDAERDIAEIRAQAKSALFNADIWQEIKEARP